MSEQQDQLNETFNVLAYESGKWIVLVEFHGPTCSLCKFVWSQLEPMLNALPNPVKQKVIIHKLDVMSYPQDAIDHGITSIPTIILFIIEDGLRTGSIRFEKPISIPAIKNKIIEELQ